MTRALIFDCDGVIVDVEINRQRCAFNQVWQELGIKWEWDEAEYARLLEISGGKERLLFLQQDPAFREVYDVPADAEWRKTVARWHQRKTEIYVEMTRGRTVARPGVRRLALEALQAGWRIGVASAGARASVEAVVRNALGEDLLRRFTLVTGEDTVHKKPAPEVYTLAVKSLAVHPCDCLVVEDTRNGLLAATAAGMACLITPTQYTFHDDFSEAALVISGLGEPDGPAEVVIGGRCWTGARPYLRLDDLVGLMSASRSAWELSSR